MELFYTPQHARVGDVIPFYEDGMFRLFYLKNWNAYWGADRTEGWHMLTTRDNLHILSESPTGVLAGLSRVLRCRRKVRATQSILLPNRKLSVRVE